MTPMLLLLLACGTPAPSGHSHGPGGHAHGPSGGHVAPDTDSIGITLWTDTHELFVELDAPVQGQKFAYHAHVTRLADNEPATSGTWTVRFEQDGFPAESHSDAKVARAGIFSGEAPAPTAGDYQLVFQYTNGDEQAVWAPYDVTVGENTPAPHTPQSEGDTTFLKEAQWQVDFAIERAATRPLAPVVHANAVVHPAPSATKLVATPVDGLLVWTNGLPVAGRRVQAGEQVAALLPAGVSASWSQRQAELQAAKANFELAEAELQRLTTLRAQELVSERRLQAAKAEHTRAKGAVAAGQRQVSAMTSGSGAMTIRSPMSGVITSVGAEHGETVSAGTPVLEVSTGTDLLLEARVHERRRGPLQPVHSVSARRGDWPQARSVHRAQVLNDTLIYDPVTLSAPLSLLAPAQHALSPGDLVDLEISAGERTERLAVPRTAVVEINGQDVVFVQQTGESFTRRKVELGLKDATHVEIRSGIAPGEWVVAKGGFDVHVASLAGTLESHTH